MHLSIMICDGLRRLLSAFGCTVTRSNGASTSILVMGRMVTVGCVLNRFDWTTRAGRGLPKSPCMAIITRSPRIYSVQLSVRSEEHTSELQSLMRISYAVFCLKKKKQINEQQANTPRHIKQL